AADFDPRRQAISRVYRYLIDQAPWPLPFWRRYRWHVREPLDIDAMRAAAAPLLGTHDFAAFTARGGDLRSTIRRLDRITIARSGETIAVEFEGNAFLPHFVRTVVGALVAVGAGRRSASDIASILASRDRRLAGPAAPGHGLYLVRVRYPGDPPDTGEGDWR
ncbi:MAG: tRNA pseudouridine(38-40) synthase TruA, partial [Dehalococcoidia bacterium]|nr:tRNA pseudouridine(38-40) synthase TruA [Dehalococcoidia bacterium]